MPSRTCSRCDLGMRGSVRKFWKSSLSEARSYSCSHDHSSQLELLSIAQIFRGKQKRAGKTNSKRKLARKAVMVITCKSVGSSLACACVCCYYHAVTFGIQAMEYVIQPLRAHCHQLHAFDANAAQIQSSPSDMFKLLGIQLTSHMSSCTASRSPDLAAAQ